MVKKYSYLTVNSDVRRRDSKVVCFIIHSIQLKIFVLALWIAKLFYTIKICTKKHLT